MIYDRVNAPEMDYKQSADDTRKINLPATGVNSVLVRSLIGFNRASKQEIQNKLCILFTKISRLFPTECLPSYLQSALIESCISHLPPYYGTKIEPKIRHIKPPVAFKYKVLGTKSPAEGPKIE
jgi:hypothetical protein